MSGRTRHRAWYIVHTSAMVRLPRPKPFAARTFLQDNVIIEIWEGT
jgi:hypothetical protein